MDLMKPSKWLTPNKIDEDVVISSRARLARNLKEYRFPRRMSEGEMQEVLHKMKEIVESEAFIKAMGSLEFLDMAALDIQEKTLLLEKHLISPNLFAINKGRGVIIGLNDEISIMVNEEDHLRIQGFLGGLNVEGTLKLVTKIDEELEKYLDYAFHPELGYLTVCPTNIGSGLRISVMLHLPSLVFTQEVKKLAEELAGQGFTLRGYYGEGSKADGDIFQISNQRTLGMDEEDIAQKMEKICKDVVNKERAMRQELKEKMQLELEDRIGRAVGILERAVLISSGEALKLLSNLRLAVNMGFDLPYSLDMEFFNHMLNAIQPGHLQIYYGEKMDSRTRDQKRADLIREQLAMRKER